MTRDKKSLISFRCLCILAAMTVAATVFMLNHNLKNPGVIKVICACAEGATQYHDDLEDCRTDITDEVKCASLEDYTEEDDDNNQFATKASIDTYFHETETVTTERDGRVKSISHHSTIKKRRGPPAA